MQPGNKQGLLYAGVILAGCFAALAALVAVESRDSISTYPSQAADTTEASKPVNPCQRFVELKNAAAWAQELGRSEFDVQANHRINVWAHQAPYRGGKVGELLVGSFARIVDEAGSDYKIVSPFDGSVGWIGSAQVVRVVRRNDETNAPC